MASRYYLDTTAQVERHAGELAVQRNIKALLGRGRHATSTHVSREWKHIIHLSAVEVLNACDGAETVRDVKARLRQGGWGRRPAHRAMALDMLCGEPSSVSEIAIRVEQFLRSRADAFFQSKIDEVRDGSACMLAAERARRDVKTGRWAIRTKCSMAECDCNQVPFTDHQAHRIDNAAVALLASEVAEHRNMGRNAREAMGHADKTHRKGSACWGSRGLGGDISIALECAEDETLLTTDRSFDEICPAIGVKHRRITATRAP